MRVGGCLFDGEVFSLLCVCGWYAVPFRAQGRASLRHRWKLGPALYYCRHANMMQQEAVFT